MDHELIRSWLELPPGPWPPDHYTLLGLDPSVTDAVRIEQHVHTRMERVRSYQLTHPELATEAMNCLARALICLSDPQARMAYDQELVSGQANQNTRATKPPQLMTRESPTPPATGTTVLDWQTAPPPLRQPRDISWPAALQAMSRETLDTLVLPGPRTADTATDNPPAVPSEGRADSGVQSEVPQPEEQLFAGFSRRGLGSKRALYYQITRTRQLIWAWEQVGKYLNRPTRLVSRPTEATEFIQYMGVIRDLLPSAMPALGEAGQPGYLVLALARQQLIVPMLQTLLPSQREALARDWQAGHAVLRSVRLFLHQELRAVRRRRGWRHALRLMGAILRDHPGLVLLVLAWLTVIAVNVADWPASAGYLRLQLITFLALVVVLLARWRSSFQQIRRFAVPQPTKRLPRKSPQTRREPDSSRL